MKKSHKDELRTQYNTSARIECKQKIRGGGRAQSEWKQDQAAVVTAQSNGKDAKRQALTDNALQHEGREAGRSGREEETNGGKKKIRARRAIQVAGSSGLTATRRIAACNRT